MTRVWCGGSGEVGNQVQVGGGNDGAADFEDEQVQALPIDDRGERGRVRAVRDFRAVWVRRQTTARDEYEHDEPASPRLRRARLRRRSKSRTPPHLDCGLLPPYGSRSARRAAVATSRCQQPIRDVGGTQRPHELLMEVVLVTMATLRAMSCE